MLTVLGRPTRAISTGGLTVLPGLVEAVLGTHPAVGECAVFGVADDRLGQRVVVAIVALLGSLMTAGYLLQTVGINHTSSTNAAFITVLYVVLAPAGAALIGRHSPDRVDVACLALALVGLGLLSIRGGSLRAGDLLVLAGAAAFAGHIVSPSTCSSTGTPPRPSRSPRWRRRRC